MKYRCPVCFYDQLPYPPAGYHVCPCCGTEFGNDDAEFSHQQLRDMWIAGGANWFFGKAPENWNPWYQLIENGYFLGLPFQSTFHLWGYTGVNRVVCIGQERNYTPHFV